MAHNVKLANAAANAAATAIVALLNSGKGDIYNAPQPATADTAITTQTLLAEVTFNAGAGGSPTLGVITFAAITADADADASGTPTWMRLKKSDGTPVMDCTVGLTSDYDIVIDAVPIVQHATISLDSLTFTQNKG